MPVPAPVTSPSTTARAKLKTILQNEFAAEGFPVYDDRIHRSMGRDRPVIGTSPVTEVPWANDKNVLRCTILVQFYGRWKSDPVDPAMRVDPAPIEAYAERFRRALYKNDPLTDRMWYFNLIDVTYLPDPTGNISRFEARVEAIGDNSAVLLETG